MPTSATVDYSQFFLLEDPLADRPLRLEIVSREDRYASWEYFRGEVKPVQPIRLKAKMGGQATDFLWTTGGSVICVSSRVVELLRQKDYPISLIIDDILSRHLYRTYLWIEPLCALIDFFGKCISTEYHP